MNIFLFWIVVITLFLSGYLYLIYRRSPKGFRFQVKLTITFILLVLVPAIPLTSFVSGLLTQGVEMFLLPGVGESLSTSLEVIKLQLEERGDFFFQAYPEVKPVSGQIVEQNNVVYYANLKLEENNSVVIDVTGTNTPLLQKSPTQFQEVINSIQNKEIKSNLFLVSEQNICEVYQAEKNGSVKVVAFKLDTKVFSAKEKIAESLRIYNSLSLIKKSVVEGQIIWGFSTLFIILLALIAIYAAKNLSRGISGPIQELVVGMQHVSEGDLTKPVQVKAKDEIKFVIDSFNKMTTELKTSQAKLLQAERLAAWQDVARRVSHEIRNTLTPIQLSVRRLWNNFSTEKDTKNDVSFRTINDEIESLRRISEEFSEFARMPQIKPAKEDLNELIRSLTTFIEATPGPTTIRLNLDEQLPPVNLDRSQVRRALHNLIKNSIEASEGLDSITEILVESTAAEKEHYSVKIKIQDFGSGIDPETLNKIFEPYYTTKKRGMGLGLSIVKRIIEDHNGTIDFSSRQGKGTCVEIYL
jgi:two-component system, NtrC family, nitrogen regulation sensor histidine kinase NtrY